MNDVRPIRLLAAALLSTMAYACASPPPAQATLTAADIAKLKEPPAPKDNAPPPMPEDAGKLACRAASRDEGTTELYLKWENGSAKGVLRTTAPSGNVTMLNVGADSHNGVTVVDDVLTGDLVEHAAVVKSQDGKRVIHLHGASAWLTCTYES